MVKLGIYYSIGTWKKCIVCSCWMKCSINVNEILLIDGVVEFFKSLWIFSLILSIDEKGVLMFPTIIVDLSISPFSSISFCSHILPFYLGVHTFKIVKSSQYINTYHCITYISVCSNFLCSEVYSIWY